MSATVPVNPHGIQRNRINGGMAGGDCLRGRGGRDGEVGSRGHRDRATGCGACLGSVKGEPTTFPVKVNGPIVVGVPVIAPVLVFSVRTGGKLPVEIE
jgi:hypothetical protein